MLLRTRVSTCFRRLSNARASSLVLPGGGTTLLALALLIEHRATALERRAMRAHPTRPGDGGRNLSGTEGGGAGGAGVECPQPHGISSEYGGRGASSLEDAGGAAGWSVDLEEAEGMRAVASALRAAVSTASRNLGQDVREVDARTEALERALAPHAGDAASLGAALRALATSSSAPRPIAPLPVDLHGGPVGDGKDSRGLGGEDCWDDVDGSLGAIQRAVDLASLVLNIGLAIIVNQDP
ncbi:hypothetical protein T484DRAFT_1929361 [Baffinella frigidus]|nr:hypothetical protein T484DRAFT_1929361 [Cryptophyta sp. CCMP2293]